MEHDGILLYGLKKSESEKPQYIKEASNTSDVNGGK